MEAGKIILNLAISLDGYIADQAGGYDWIAGDGGHSLDTQEQWSYEEFLQGIDIVIMGRRCYDQGFHRDFPTKEVWVASSRPEELDCTQVRGVGPDLCSLAQDAKSQGKRIFLFGGGITIAPFLEQDLIDEYILGLVPIVLGGGRPLFVGNPPTIPLRLAGRYIDGGVTILRYLRRDAA